mmetsp:Transcript_3414/g.7432  ORF Transcript_3414/g.7432 Transcript_3414/m.7432 type:complete len:561 (+) Transcript_3414:101-1783(+)
METIARTTRHLSRIAVSSGGNKYTYGKVLHLAEDTAAAVSRIISKGPAPVVPVTQTAGPPPRIGVYATPGVEYLAATWAVWQAGGIVVPLATSHPPAELAYCFQDAGLSAVLVPEANVDKVSEVAAQHNTPLHVMARPDACQTGQDPATASSTAGSSSSSSSSSSSTLDRGALIIYTSGTTGKPKGVLHTTAGYAVGAAITFKYVFDYKEDDVYWCTADCGWITGHTYVAYGPLFSCASQVLFEGIPTYPDASRCWQVVDKYKVSILYTAPTAIRSLMAKGDGYVHKYRRTSLRLLGTVGEPINPEAWRWYHEVVGDSRCPIVDTWWQTETGGHMITPLAGVWPEKPGSATLPFFGVVPVVLDEKGNELVGEAEGVLAIKQPWPSTLRTVYGDHKRYEENYFGPFPGYYFTGDGCRRDADGYFWITGRVDDVINVSGHRIGTAEVESALVAHPACAEAAVVGYDHPIKGQGIYAYVTLMEGVEYSDKLRKELVGSVRNTIGAFAAPDVIHWAPGLPKTRSGKIMRRVLRKIASKEEDQLGDTSTLADPGVVQQLVELRGK